MAALAALIKNNNFIKLYSYMGTKIRMLNEINELLPDDSFTYNYIEPFLGSGVVFLNLEKQFKKYFLNDIIPSLILFFKNYDKLNKELIDELINYEITTFNIEKNKEGYYKFRDNIYNIEKDNLRKTIYFFMIANCCINNMCRFNKNTFYFNQSFGNRKYSHRIKDIYRAIEYCKGKNIIATSKCFKNILNNVDINDNNFLFIDPPYFGTRYTTEFTDTDISFLINWLKINNKKIKFIYIDFENKYNQKLKNICSYKYIEKIRNVSPNRKNEIIYKEIFYYN